MLEPEGVVSEIGAGVVGMDAEEDAATIGLGVILGATFGGGSPVERRAAAVLVAGIELETEVE